MSETFTNIEVAILSGGWDRPYAFGLTNALVNAGTTVHLVAGDDLTAADFRNVPGLTVLNYRVTNGPQDSTIRRALRLFNYYRRLISFAWRAKPRLFHILWNNGYDFFDRVVLTSYYRLLGLTICLTAHNVNAGVRDGNDSLFNRLTLRVQYGLCHHIFVHTEAMKVELIDGFGINRRHVTVVPFGINDAVPRSELVSSQARARLGISTDDRVLLFFGNIAPYKGLEYLVGALPILLKSNPRYRLVVAGRVKAGCSDYWNVVERTIGELLDPDRVTLRTEFIPDDETEVYFKAADLLVLPYVHVFQSGVLFLGYSFGLPAIVAEVGALSSEVATAQVGGSFLPRDAPALAEAVENYFRTPFAELPDAERRSILIERIQRTHSWSAVAELTRAVYANARCPVSDPPCTVDLGAD